MEGANRNFGLTVGDADHYRPDGLSAARPVILVADQPWDAAGGGAIILRSLIEESIGDGIIWATPSSGERALTQGHYGLRSGSLGRTGNFSLLDDLLRYSPRLANELAELARQTNAAGIWAVLHGATIGIAAHLTATCGLPLHVTVHDDPVYATTLRSRRMALFTPVVAHYFRSAIRRARSIDVVCPQMAERYAQKFGVKSRILHRGLTSAPLPSPAYDLRQSGLIFGILGNTYSYEQLPILGRALALAADRLGVRGRVVVCGQSHGSRLQQEMKDAIEVEATGHISEQDGIFRLSHCGLLYLNYPFGWINRVLGQTSFPTKLSTYIYAARPILVHAPERTTLASLPRDNGFVTAWTSLDPAEGASRIISIVENPGFAQSHHKSAESIRVRFYDLATHRATLNAIFGQLTKSY